MIWEILDDWMIELDVMISFNGKAVGMHDTMLVTLGLGMIVLFAVHGEDPWWSSEVSAATA